MDKKKIALIITIVVTVSVVAIILFGILGNKDKIDCKYNYKIKFKDNIATVKLYKGDDIDCEWYMSYGEKKKVDVEKQTAEKYDIFTITVKDIYIDSPVFELKRNKETVYSINSIIYADSKEISEFIFTGIETVAEAVKYNGGKKIPFETESTDPGSMVVLVKSKNNIYYEGDDGTIFFLADYVDGYPAYIVRVEDDKTHVTKISDDSEKINTTVEITVGQDENGMLYVADSQETDFVPSEKYKKDRTIFGVNTEETTETETTEKNSSKKSKSSNASKD